MLEAGLVVSKDAAIDASFVAADAREAADSAAPEVHANIHCNQAFHWTVAGGDVDASFAGGARCVTATWPHPGSRARCANGCPIRRAHATGER